MTRNPIPPDHGEPEYAPGVHGRGSNVYTPEEWAAAAWAYERFMNPVPATPEEDIPW